MTDLIVHETLLPEEPPEVLRARICAFEQVLMNTPGAMTGAALDCWCPLTHSFAPGIYVREIFLPKGTVLTGKIHRHAHPNFLMRGSVVVVTEGAGRQYLRAPLALISPAGTKRAVVALEDTVWITVHHNPENLTDLEALEAEIIAPDYAALLAGGQEERV